MSKHVDWVGLEQIGESRILTALSLALRGRPIAEIAREAGIPKSSLYSVKVHGPYEHRKRQKAGSTAA